MKKRLVSSALAVGTVTLIAGAAFSGGSTTSQNELEDFDQSHGTLWAYPQNQQTVSEYQHTPTTVHHEGDLALFEPPNPCHELTALWNYTLRYDAFYHVDSRGIRETLITLMAQSSCGAQITATSGSPAPMTDFTPASPTTGGGNGHGNGGGHGHGHGHI